MGLSTVEATVCWYLRSTAKATLPSTQLAYQTAKSRRVETCILEDDRALIL